MEFKEASLADKEHCLEMMKDFYRLDNYPFDQVRASVNFREFIVNQELGKYWVIINKSEVIGYLVLTFGFSFEHGGRDAFIDEFYLKEEYRGKGIGTEILQSLDYYAKKLKINALHLEVERTNKVGDKLYIKSGYKGNDRSLLTKIIKQE